MTRISTITLALAATLALSACSTDAETIEPNVTTPDAVGSAPFDGSHVDVDAWAEAASSEGVVIIDVRTPEEYDFDHIPGAINIDLYSGVFEAEVGLLDPEVSYAVYCHSGNRSREALSIMANLGITSTIGLEGGINAWATAGNPLVTD